MSLLFSESPILGIVTLTAPIVVYHYKAHNALVGVLVLFFLFFLYFYRYEKYEGTAEDHEIICPCEGTVLKVKTHGRYLYIAIFLSPFNRHTQIYPVNGTVIKRHYDHSGEFEIVMDLNKSKYNEKNMHWIQMKNGTIIQITQIAGFLPRMITSSDKVPMEVKAGDYLGMMKFGSRVDLLLPLVDNNKKMLDCKIEEGQELNIGDMIGGYYLSMIN